MLEIGICDDESACAQELERLLTQYFARREIEAAISVFSGAEDLLRADWQRFSILFLDIVMQERDGVSAAAEIRRKNPDVSLIFVSAFLDYATMGYQVKASAYLLILCPLRFALNNSVPAAADLFAVVQLRCRAIGAVFLPPCALHQEILLADLALPRIVSVVQSFKEVRQNKAVIALKGHSSGSDKDATISPFRESNIFRV